MRREGETRGYHTWPGACRPSSRPRLIGPHPAGALASGARKCTQTINFPPRPARLWEAGVRPPLAASPRRAPHSGRGDCGGRQSAAGSRGGACRGRLASLRPLGLQSSARSRATAFRSLLYAAEEVGLERWSGAGDGRGLGEASRGWNEEKVTGSAAGKASLTSGPPLTGGGGEPRTWGSVA